ncbi:hypothetical protein NLG97_g6298 [Lecanicillium saksenae]|uniref:Uncharacterized protein n=1 Tax=Lecanicillium saksenae TaxID=468837 RepID=A0ACC1QQ59_9HYPO|nr:hypothetical protein NLG97_g6298 [Lecanicillium saksenae]
MSSNDAPSAQQAAEPDSPREFDRGSRRSWLGSRATDEEPQFDSHRPASSTQESTEKTIDAGADDIGASGGRRSIHVDDSSSEPADASNRETVIYPIAQGPHVLGAGKAARHPHKSNSGDHTISDDDLLAAALGERFEWKLREFEALYSIRG